MKNKTKQNKQTNKPPKQTNSQLNTLSPPPPPIFVEWWDKFTPFQQNLHLGVASGRVQRSFFFLFECLLVLHFIEI